MNNLLKKYQTEEAVTLEAIDAKLDELVLGLEEIAEDEEQLIKAEETLDQQQEVIDEIQSNRELSPEESKLVVLGRQAIAQSVGVDPEIVADGIAVEADGSEQSFLKKIAEGVKKGFEWLIEKLIQLGKWVKDKIMKAFGFFRTQLSKMAKGLKDLGKNAWNAVFKNRKDLLRQGYLVDNYTKDVVDLNAIQVTNFETLHAYSNAIGTALRATSDSFKEAREAAEKGQEKGYNTFNVSNKIYELPIYIPGYQRGILGGIVAGKLPMVPKVMDIDENGDVEGYTPAIIKKLLDVANLELEVKAGEQNMKMLLKDQENATKGIQQAEKIFAADVLRAAGANPRIRQLYKQGTKAVRREFTIFTKLLAKNYQLSYNAVKVRWQFLSAYLDVSKKLDDQGNLLENKAQTA